MVGVILDSVGREVDRRVALKLLVTGLSLAVAGCKNMGHEKGENEMQINSADVPAAAMSSFNRDHPGATVTKVKKEETKNGNETTAQAAL